VIAADDDTQTEASEETLAKLKLKLLQVELQMKQRELDSQEKQSIKNGRFTFTPLMDHNRCSCWLGDCRCGWLHRGSDES
jgi:hypothetical protein